MKSESYQEILHEKMSDPEQAAEHLTACYEEGPEVFLGGLRDVVEAQGRHQPRGGNKQVEPRESVSPDFTQGEPAFDKFEFRAFRAWPQGCV